MTNLTKIEELALSYNNDVELVKKALKKFQSAKCRLAKQKGRSDYEAKMTEILAEERALQEVRRLLEPKPQTSTTLSQEDIELLDYTETMKALESIRSKKSNTRWLTTVEGDNDEFRAACQIEQWLLEHKQEVKPIDETTIRKTELANMIDVIESSGELSTERIVEMLKSLL